MRMFNRFILRLGRHALAVVESVGVSRVQTNQPGYFLWRTRADGAQLLASERVSGEHRFLNFLHTDYLNLGRSCGGGQDRPRCQIQHRPQGGPG